MTNKFEARLSPKKILPDIIEKQVNDSYNICLSNSPILMQGGTENAGWLIETINGKFVIKVFAESGEKIASIYEEVRLYEYLNGCGLSAPQVVETGQGLPVGLLTAEGFDYPIVMMKLEELRRVSPSTVTQHEVELLAHTIAQMHRALQDYPRQNQIPQLSLPQSSLIAVGDINDLFLSPNASVFSEYELRDARLIDDKLVRYVKMHSINILLTETILHGDLSLGHAQFLPNGRLYLFDFSDFSLGPVVWDLATLLVYFYKEGGISIKRWKELKYSLLSSYNEKIPLKDDDLKVINFCLIDRILFEIRILNHLSRKEMRLVDAEGNKNRYHLAKFLLNDTYYTIIG